MQPRSTCPLKPFRGVMVTVAIVLFPIATLDIPELTTEKEGDAVTVSGTEPVVAIEEVEAEVAVTVTAYAPTVVAEVVLTCTCAMAGSAPFNVTEAGTEQMGRLCALDRVVATVQERFT